MNGFDIPNNINLSSPEATKQIWSYVLSMQEQLEYWLRNLDAQNFNDAGLKEIAGMFKANTIISNTNITQEIYADYGNIADLTVDKLRTDYTKAQKYLLGDTSDVNYLYIHDETISFITATVGIGTEQLTDGDRVFYWTDETHTQMTSEKTTDYPVIVYQYTELVKAKIAFQQITTSAGTTTVMPVFTLGAGTGNGDVGKASIYKSTDGLYLDYCSETDGKVKQILIGNDGISISGVTISSTGWLTPTITVTADSGSTVTATCGSSTVTGTSNGTCTLNIPAYGTWTVTATLSGNTASGTVVVDTVKQYTLELSCFKIYGVSWSGGPSTAWTRTDDAAGFSDPVPALSNGSGSSPFDSCYPWSDIVKESRTGGVMVKIPKYWFKWTKSGGTLALQIADKAVDGFSVSPAHMDRGDGKGERDYVYVGRYHCNSSYLSATGSSPIASITRDTARSSIHAKGSTIWQMDYAMRLTIWMLMLVEFADNDFQTKIGYGCGNNSAAGAMGYTDSMTYHTGTTKSDRTTYGLGTQYRYIEGLWDNVLDWMDGCYYSGSGMSVIKNPANFSDTANGNFIGTPTSGYPSVMSLSTASGFEWCIYPTTSNGSVNTYFPDYWNFDASYPCLYSGGCFNQYLYYGAFCVSYAHASDTDVGIGCRLQELP